MDFDETNPTLQVSAVICTYNPRPDYLERTLNSLRLQTLDRVRWELIIIDNASPEPLEQWVDVSWHRNGRVVREMKPGLTPARIRGYAESSAPLIVFIDDDNELDDNYLQKVIELFEEQARLGAIGGKSIPDFEVEPDGLASRLVQNLACRDIGEKELRASWNDIPVEHRHYPSFSPVGAGMAIRKSAIASYVQEIEGNAARSALDRTGNSLASGGDNDIVMTVLEHGWEVGYSPALRLVHLIPARRMTKSYLSQLVRDSTRTWILVLDAHGLRPWKRIHKWTIPLRKLKSYLLSGAWKDDYAYVRWQGFCGQYEGRAMLQQAYARTPKTPSSYRTG